MSTADETETRAAAGPVSARSRVRRVARGIALAAGTAIIVSSPWWGRAGLQRLAFFRVQRIEVVGLKYLPPSEVVQRLRVDTTNSIWDDKAKLEGRVRQHPDVEDVSIERKLPGTFIVHVRERLPVALVSTPAGLRAVDRHGKALPIDPQRTGVDAPIVNGAADTAAFRLLGDLRAGLPALFDRISEIRRPQSGELLVLLQGAGELPVRALSSVSADRLAEIIPVEDDLARRQVRVAELDLRYRDQVIARLQ